MTRIWEGLTSEISLQAGSERFGGRETSLSDSTIDRSVKIRGSIRFFRVPVIALSSLVLPEQGQAKASTDWRRLTDGRSKRQ